MGIGEESNANGKATANNANNTQTSGAIPTGTTTTSAIYSQSGCQQCGESRGLSATWPAGAGYTTVTGAIINLEG